jgi:hypothetical protein
MALSNDGQFKIENLPIVGAYNKQRFPQWCPEDTANFYIVKGEDTKKPYAMYPTLGRAHINYNGVNQLIFGSEPRGIFKSINYLYIVEGSTIYQFDNQYNRKVITGLGTNSGILYFTFLVVNSLIFTVFVDQQHIYIYQEGTPALQLVTDPLAPGNYVDTITGKPTLPGYIASFGNRIVVSVLNSSQFILSAINLQGKGAANPVGYNFDPAKCFTNFTTDQVFATEDGIIRQMGVLNNTLYIFTDYITGVWSNIPAIFSGTGATFPWKKNTTYNWNFGIANSSSLDIDFGIMVFLARNSDGLLEFRMSNGGQPEKISDKSIDTLLQNYTNALSGNNPFLVQNSNGFLYQYENTIFYRMSGGEYYGYGLLDQEQTADSIEYSFESKEWHRVIEQNGERNRVQNHVYFNYMHLVTVTGDSTVYNMSGQFYSNEITNPDQTNNQDPTSYLIQPFRYERTTPILYQQDYSEFETEYVQIDFVFGNNDLNNPDFTPSIELFWSDDGGISFNSADHREFSPTGLYSWRMRWYQLGCSRNRVYKLVCVSSVPIVVLGGCMNMRRSSGGAN